MFGRYLKPDELPREGYGFGVGGRSDDMENEDDDNEDDDNEDEKKIKSGKIPSSTGEFHYIFQESDYDLPNFALLYGKMIHTATMETVGVISADLLLKRRKGLYRVCDDRSQALIDVARCIINDDGSLRAGMKQAIGDEHRARAAAVGGLLHLDEVHILQRYRGRDLGLELIFALLRSRSEASCRALLERGADPLLRDLNGCTPFDTNTAANTADVQSMIDFEASRAPLRVVVRESAASEQSRRNKPASVLLQRATAARRSQHEARKMLVQCLLYSRRPALPSDVLRKVHAAVPPLPVDAYPTALATALGLLDAMTDVMLTGIVSRKELNGQNAKILGTHADRYMVKIVLTGEEIKVKADNVLPLTRPVQASAGAAESDDDDDDDDDGW